MERLQRRWRDLALVHLPLHPRWLNQIEIYFSIVRRKVLEPNDFPGLATLASTLNAFERHWSEVAEPSLHWRFTRDDLAALMARLSVHEPQLPPRRMIASVLAAGSTEPGSAVHPVGALHVVSAWAGLGPPLRGRNVP